MPRLARRIVPAGFVGGLAGAVLLVVGLCACDADGGPAGDGPQVLVALRDTEPGDVVGLTADDSRRVVSWVHRRDGTVHELRLDEDDAPRVVAEVDVSTASEQGGLLGQALLDGRRFVSFTTREGNELAVAELHDGGEPEVVWSAGRAGDGAIGGVLLPLPDASGLLLGLGRNTDWDRDTEVGGALVRLDPDGGPDQREVVVSAGYTNPWAFAAVGTDPRAAEIWVADNAAGPDPDDPDVDDVERVGRADLVADRDEMERVPWEGRAPSAMVELPDGRLGICGFLDDELRAYEIVDTDAGPRTGLDRAGTVMPCLTGAAVFADGTVVTAASTGGDGDGGDGGQALYVLRP